MSSFVEAESSCTPSVIAASTTASRTGKKGKKSSFVWAYTREPLSHEDQSLIYYSYCDINNDPYGANTSSLMTKHIRSMHSHVNIKKNVSKTQQVVRQ